MVLFSRICWGGSGGGGGGGGAVMMARSMSGRAIIALAAGMNSTLRAGWSDCAVGSDCGSRAIAVNLIPGIMPMGIFMMGGVTTGGFFGDGLGTTVTLT